MEQRTSLREKIGLLKGIEKGIDNGTF